MRNGVSLAVIRNEVLIEAGYSTEAGHAAYSKERIDQLINRQERRLALDPSLDWPALKFEQSVTIAANSRYGNLPSDITFTMISTAHVAFGDDWLPLYHGIEMEHRSIYNENQRAEPVMRWEIQHPGDAQFEVWPVPSTVQTIRFSGQKAFGAMARDDDTCAIDADVLVMTVAAQILGRDRKEDAALLMEQGMEHARMVCKRQGSMKREGVQLARRPGMILRPGIDFIPPGSV
jgi:hypothetical protein